MLDQNISLAIKNTKELLVRKLLITNNCLSLIIDYYQYYHRLLLIIEYYLLLKTISLMSYYASFTNLRSNIVLFTISYICITIDKKIPCAIMLIITIRSIHNLQIFLWQSYLTFEANYSKIFDMCFDILSSRKILY